MDKDLKQLEEIAAEHTLHDFVAWQTALALIVETGIHSLRLDGTGRHMENCSPCIAGAALKPKPPPDRYIKEGRDG